MECQKLSDRTGRIALLYWGRRGLSRFFYDLTNTTYGCNTLITLARANENFPAFAARFQDRLVAFDLFDMNAGAALGIARWPRLRRQLADMLRQHQITTLIDVMPHVWMPIFLPVIRASGARYIAIAHDGAIHPGDWRSRLAKMSNDYCLRRADHVVALSETVAEQLRAQFLVSDANLSVLFHPDLSFGAASRPAPRNPEGPIRLVFMGRIMPYKGLSLFVDMVEVLRASGLPVACGVFGEGDLGRDAARLSALGAEIINRWLDDAEIANILSRYDVLIASHIEASQSGVVAAALGAGLPVIATPVGGLVEQIESGVTGLVAQAVNADSLAAEVRRIALTPGLYDTMRNAIQEQAGARSMAAFARALMVLATDPTKERNAEDMQL